MASNENFPLKKINVNNWNSRAVMGSMFFWLRLCSYNMLRRGIDDLWAMVTSWSHLILWSLVLKGWSKRLLLNGEVKQKEHQPGGLLALPNSLTWEALQQRGPLPRDSLARKLRSREEFFVKEAAVKADRSSCLWMTMKWQVWGITYLDSERFHLKTNFICTYDLGWLVRSTGWGGREHLEDPH